MAKVDTLPEETTLIFGVHNDKIISITPKDNGIVVDRTGKRMRFIMKASKETPDADAFIDIDSVTDSTDVFGVGVAATGQWSIDLSDYIDTVGDFWFRVDLTVTASLDTSRHCYARGPCLVEDV